MGCDIHPYTEFKKEDQWFTGDAWEPSPWGDGPTVPQRFEIYGDRHYNWFAFLCGVRSGTWGDDAPMISEPKGVPADCCAEIRAQYETWDSDGHSASWVTLEELDAAWKEHKDHLVWFDAVPMMGDEELAEWLLLPPEKRPPPKSYAQSSFGGGVMKPRHKWCESINDLIGNAYEATRSFLWDLSWDKGVPASDVRMVFWFDN